MNKSLKITLVISVFINLLLAGIVIGHLSHHLSNRFKGKELSQLNIPGSQEKQKKIMARLKKIYENNSAVKDQVRKTKDEAFLILSAPQFDEKAYQEKFDRMILLREKDKRYMAGEIKEMAKTLDQEERIILAEILRRPGGDKNKFIRK